MIKIFTPLPFVKLPICIFPNFNKLKGNKNFLALCFVNYKTIIL